MQPRGPGSHPASGGRGDPTDPPAVPISHQELRRWMLLDQLPWALDLFPSRGQPIGMLVTGVAAISVLIGLFLGLGTTNPSWTDRPLSAFGLDGPGNVASWFATLVLTAAGLCSLIAWWLENIDEGEDTSPPRAWLLGAILWPVMGLDESVGLHPILSDFVVGRTNLWPDMPAQLSWMLLYGLAFLAFGIRAVPAMARRRSALAILLFLSAAAAYALSAWVQLFPRIPLPVVSDRVLWEEVPELAGHWLVLTAMSCHTRRLLQALMMGDGRDEPPDPEAPLATFRELVWRRSQTTAPSGEPAEAQGFSDDLDAALENGDFLIIHPPHIRGRGRVVSAARRIIRRRSSSSVRARRSDLDLPQAVGTLTPPAATLAAPSATPMPTSDAATSVNAFLAGMAYAETQRAAAQMQNATPSVPSSPAPWGTPRDEAVRYGWNAGRADGTPQPPSASHPALGPSPTARNYATLGPSSMPGAAHPADANTTTTSESVSTRFAGGMSVQGWAGRAQPGLGNQPSPAYQQIAGPQFPAAAIGATISPNPSPAPPQATGHLGPTSGNSGSPQNGGPEPSPVGISRKLTKEEKKRLRELYERRLAQQQQSATA